MLLSCSDCVYLVIFPWFLCFSHSWAGYVVHLFNYLSDLSVFIFKIVCFILKNDWMPHAVPCDWTKHLRETDATLKTGDTVQRWFTAASIKTVIPGLQRNGRESGISSDKNSVMSWNIFTLFSVTWRFISAKPEVIAERKPRLFWWLFVKCVLRGINKEVKLVLVQLRRETWI